MSSATSKVVGLIEMDVSPSQDEHPLRPPVTRTRRPVARWSPPDDIIYADLDQLNDDLRVELASVVTRIRRS